MQTQGHGAGNKMIHALLEACSTRSERIESIECLAEAEKDARQSVLSATTTGESLGNRPNKWYIDKFERMKISDRLIIDDEDSTKISSRMPTEYAQTDPSSEDFCSTEGTRKRLRTWLNGQRCRNKVIALEARRNTHCGSNIFGRTTIRESFIRQVHHQRLIRRPVRQQTKEQQQCTRRLGSVTIRWYIAKFE